MTLETDSILQVLDYSDCSYSSFQDYTQMKFLVVDERFLGSPLPDDFPASLEYLVIDNCQSSVFEWLSSLANFILTGTEIRCLTTISLHAHVFFPGGMLGLSLKGATDLLFKQAQKDLVDLFFGTKLVLRFEQGLLEKTFLGYETASEEGSLGDYEPFLYVA